MTTSRFLLSLLLGSTLMVHSANAALITSASADVYNGVNSGLSDSDSGASSALAQLSGTFGSSSYDLTASAQAAAGILKAYAHTLVQDYAPQSFNTTDCTGVTYCGPAGGLTPIIPSAQATAWFTDTLIFSGSGSAYMVLDLALDGITSSLPGTGLVGGNSSAQFDLYVYQGATQIGYWSDFGGDYTLHTNPFLVALGAPVPITISLTARVDLIDARATSNYSYEGLADFGSTLELTSVDLYSNPGGTTPYGPFDLTTDSGARYSTNSADAAVPEPSTLLMAAGALAALVAGRRRARG